MLHLEPMLRLNNLTLNLDLEKENLLYLTSISVEHQIELLTFPVWVYVVGIFARKAKLYMCWLLSTLSSQYIYNK